MLVLTRKLNERIVIGENVRITVVGIRGNHVRLGIEAPPEISILRDELRRHDTPAPVAVAPRHESVGPAPTLEVMSTPAAAGCVS